MIISHNISALNAFNRLQKNEYKASKLMSKLSSGMRINNASDDSAGLAISERMRAQIRGLDMAERNVQDGISLVQTAEAGLSSILSPPLQRMRELAIQAANGTLTLEDRKKIQEEIEQIKKDIDNIATNTKFNGTTLLASSIPPVITGESYSDVKEIDQLNLNVDKMVKTNDGNFVASSIMSGGNPKGIIKFDIEGNIIWQKDITAIEPNIWSIKNIQNTDDGGFVLTGESTVPFSSAYVIKLDSNGDLVWRRDIDNLYSMYGSDVKQTTGGGFIVTGAGSTIQNADLLISKLDSSGNIQWSDCFGGYKADKGSSIIETSDGGFIALGSSNSIDTDVTDHNGTEDESDIWLIKVDSSGNKQWTKSLGGIYSDYGSDIQATDDGGFIVSGRKETTPGVFDVYVAKFDGTGGMDWERTYDQEDVNGNFEVFIKPTGDGRYIVGGGEKENASGQKEAYAFVIDEYGDLEWETTVSSGSSNYVSDIELIGEKDFLISLRESLISRQKGSPPVTSPITLKTLDLQVGANTGQSFKIELCDVRINKLNLQDIVVYPPNKAQEAIIKIDKATSMVSAECSKMGVYQSALEHISTNVSNSAYNLSNAESRIRDIDMAKGVMEMVKNKILVQTSQAMLAQANQAPSAVLGILR